MTFRPDDHRTDTPVTLTEERFDVASFVAKIPRVADLYLRSVEASQNRWRNGGDTKGPQ